MFRFRIGRIPIEVHFSHLAIAGLIAWSALEGVPAEGWPGKALAPANPNSKLIYGVCIAIWMAIVSVSILVHELGHAVVSRVFGYAPTIHLVGLGGLTNPNANETIPWHRDVLLTLAGPLAGLTLGLLAGTIGYGIEKSAVPSGPLTYALFGLFAANLIWAILNLLPITSLDGGRITTALMTRAFGRRGFFLAQLVSVGLGALVIALFWDNILLVLVIGMNVVRSMVFISAYFKGELPPAGPTHPFEIAFLHAEGKYKEGKLEEAGELLKAVAEHDLQPSLRARVHDLSGWVEVKMGEGRKALDHFAQVQGLTVAPQALAAAFSLIGDETRALPLWEQAAKTTKDPTLLHEWAGALIRDGQVDKARGIPGVKPGLGHAAAARTWFVRKDFLHAAEANEASYAEEPNPERAYDAACGYALAGRTDDALRMLETAGKTGEVRADKAEWDPELVSLRSDPRFAALLDRLRQAARVRA
jgi:Zn-dependent protease